MSTLEQKFEFTIDRVGDALIEMQYIGYLGEQDVALPTRLGQMLAEARGRLGMYVDVTRLTGFHRSQVTRHGSVLLGHRARLTGIAIVGASPVVRFGGITVGLLSKVQLKMFDDQPTAMEWLGTLHAAK